MVAVDARMTRQRYTDEFRATAVVMLESAGYPDKPGALVRIAHELRMPHNTLRNWYHEKHNPAPAELRQEKRLDLLELINTELEAIFGAMPNARVTANYKDLATATGILVDKRQLLTGQPTENVKAQTTIEYVNDWRETSDNEA